SAALGDTGGEHGAHVDDRRQRAERQPAVTRAGPRAELEHAAHGVLGGAIEAHPEVGPEVDDLADWERVAHVVPFRRGGTWSTKRWRPSPRILGSRPPISGLNVSRPVRRANSTPSSGVMTRYMPLRRSSSASVASA